MDAVVKGAQTAQAKLRRDAHQNQRPEGEPAFSIEAVRARAETVTQVLEDILSSGFIRVGGNIEPESCLSDAAWRGAVQPRGE